MDNTDSMKTQSQSFKLPLVNETSSVTASKVCLGNKNPTFAIALVVANQME